MRHTLFQFGYSDVSSCGEQGSSFHHIVQFSQVARPVVGGNSLLGLAVESFHISVQLLVGMLDKEVGKEEEVGTTVFQLRHVDGKLIDAVVEVFTEVAFSHTLSQVLIGSTNQSDIDIYFLVASHRTDFSFLEGTEQLHLYFIVQVSHLIEEESSSVGNLESALLVLVSTRKRSLHMTEEFRCRHLFRNGTAVECEERFVGSCAEFMDSSCHIFLTCAAGTQDEYRHRGRSHQRNETVKLA